MQVIRFDPSRDLSIVSLLNTWLAYRKMPMIKKEDHPRNGLIAYEDEEPIAMIFWLKTENNLCLVDGFIANPLVKGDVRQTALHMLIDTFLDEVKKDGLRRIIAWTANDSTFKKAISFGFKQLMGNVVLSKNL